MRRLMLTAAAAGLVCAGPLRAQQDSAATVAAARPLFASDQPLVLTLQANFDQVFKERGDEKTDHPAKLIYHNGEGTPVTLPLEINTRGHFRLKPKTCSFPPIRLNFAKDSVKGTVFEKQHKLKLTVHCQDKKAEYEQSVLQEYLIYKIFNLFTDVSFRARLAHMTYIDESGKRDTLTKWAFLIEDDDEMAKRNGATVSDLENVLDESTDPNQMPLIWVFEYFIGNTDYSVYGKHNIVLIKRPNSIFPVAVPYDFDWSGVIDAPYAFPDYRLPIKRVRERLYRGFCRTPEELGPIFAKFNENKDKIYKMYQELPDLDPKVLKRTLEYYDEFYKTINDPKSVDREFVRSCRSALARPHQDIVPVTSPE